MINVSKTKLEGVLLIKPVLYEDFRGEYVEIFNEIDYREAVVKTLQDSPYRQEVLRLHFVEDDISTGAQGVLKGIHGDAKTWKLVQCLYGKFYLVVLNYDPKSKQYGQWEAYTLSEKNRLQVLIPPMYGNGHLVLSEYDMYHYKQSEYYNPKNQFTVAWNDPRFNIWWPVKRPIVSLRDETGKRT